MPDDLSVGGFDDVPEAARAQAALTTVLQPTERLGAGAVQMVLALLAGEDLPATHIESSTRLVAWGTTSPPAPVTVREVGT